MYDFDPAKEAINLAKHGISLARWVDLMVFATVPDDRFDYGEPRYRAYGLLDGKLHSSSRSETMETGRSVYAVLMQRS